MFKVVKILISLAVLLCSAYFVFFVNLGEKTMYQHMVGISRTDEAKALGGEIEKKAYQVTDEVFEKVPSIAPQGKSEGKTKNKEVVSIDHSKPSSNGELKPESTPSDDPLSSLSDKDKDALLELLRSKSDR